MAAGCPYRGLLPYTKDDQAFFFGRERNTRIVAANLKAAPFTVLYGQSGVGKTSLLLAGVVPSLAGAAVVPFRNWQSSTSLLDLKKKCISVAEELAGKKIPHDPTAPLDELLSQLANGIHAPLFLILDQFEELFLYHPEVSGERSLDAEFARAVNRADRCANFLVAMREDSLAKLDRFSKRIPNLFANTLPLEHLDEKSARDAIELPLAAYNQRYRPEPPITIESELVDTVLTQVKTVRHSEDQSVVPSGTGRGVQSASGNRVEAPLLQLVMTKLWSLERLAGSSVLRAATMADLRGAHSIVATHLDGVLDALSAEEQDVCSRIFDRLVTPTGSKIAYGIADLERILEAEASTLAGLVARLTSEEARVLRELPGPLHAPERRAVEILHDVLARPILDWRGRYLQKQAVLATRRRMAEEAAELADRRLAEQALAQAQDLAQVAEERAQERGQALKRFRLLLAAALGLSMIAALSAIRARSAAAHAATQAQLASVETQRAKVARQDVEKKQDELSQSLSQLKSANEATRKANERLERAAALRTAFWKADESTIRRSLVQPSPGKSAFRVFDQPMRYVDDRGRVAHGYQLCPAALPDVDKLVSVTFLIDHQELRNAYLTAGENRGFTVTYSGRACVRSVPTYALAEYSDGRDPTVHAFNMCDARTPEVCRTTIANPR